MRDGEVGMSSATAALRAVALVAQRGGVTVSELARELGISTSSAHRILQTCRRLEFVRQDHAGGSYVAGQALHEIALASGAASRLRDAAGPVLRRLREDTGDTVSLVVFEGRRVRFVESLEGRPPARVASRLGRSYPAHVIAGGKAMLAFEDPARLARRFPGGHLEASAGHAVTEWDALLADLRDVRRQGWCATAGESHPDVGAVAAPVRSGTGEPVAAVAIAVPTLRLGDRGARLSLAARASSAAEAIQLRLRGVSAPSAARSGAGS